MTIHVTAETTPPSPLLERRLGTTLWMQIKPYLDAAQAAEAAEAALQAELDRLQDLESKQPDPDHARVVHAEVGKANRARYSVKIRAAVAAMAERHRLQLVEWTGTANARNLWLRNKIKSAMKLDGGFMGLKKLPSVWLINEVIKTMKF